MVRRFNINRVKKETIIKKIEESGCQMLKNKLDGTETREELVEYLIRCKCPKIHKIFSGLPKADEVD
jgi:hypothetical protein